MTTLPIARPRAGRRGTLLLATAAALGLGGLAALSTAQEANAQVNYFGAIAANPNTGTYGFSYNFRTRAAAQSRALFECRKRTRRGGCRSIVWVRNGCASVAVVRRSDGSLSRITWGIGNSRAQAQSRARQACARGACRILAWTCTNR